MALKGKSTEATRRACRKWRRLHPERQKAACDSWRERNPEKVAAALVRARPLRSLQARARKYGMTVPELEAFIAAHNGLCDACGGIGEHIDHNHTTRVVRGLLCARCNHTVGHAKEDVTRLRAVADYLEIAEKVLAVSLVDARIVTKALDRKVTDANQFVG